MSIYNSSCRHHLPKFDEGELDHKMINVETNIYLILV